MNENLIEIWEDTLTLIVIYEAAIIAVCAHKSGKVRERNVNQKRTDV